MPYWKPRHCDSRGWHDERRHHELIEIGIVKGHRANTVCHKEALPLAEADLSRLAYCGSSAPSLSVIVVRFTAPVVAYSSEGWIG